MGLDKDEGRVFESAGFGGGGGGLLGEDRGSGSAAEEDVVHLVGLEVNGWCEAKVGMQLSLQQLATEQRR